MSMRGWFMRAGIARARGDAPGLSRAVGFSLSSRSRNVFLAGARIFKKMNGIGDDGTMAKEGGF